MRSPRAYPLLLVGATVAGWSALRSAWWLWPVALLGPVPPTLQRRRDAPKPFLAALLPTSAAHAATPLRRPAHPPAITLHTFPPQDVRTAPTLTAADNATRRSNAPSITRTVPPLASPVRSFNAPTPVPTIAAIAPPPSSNAEQQRWTVAGWLFHRRGGFAAPTLSSGGQLGGSQAGLRIARRIDRAGLWEVYGRASASGGTNISGEGAVGVAFQPIADLPVRVAVERRQRLTGSDGRNAFAAFAVGGVNDRNITPDIRIDAYGAAGIVGAHRRDAFVEGWVRGGYRIVDTNDFALDAGAGGWGAAQPGVQRLDAGPSVSASWRTGALRSRLTVDYRHRVAGNARPGSGFAVTLSSGY